MDTISKLKAIRVVSPFPADLNLPDNKKTRTCRLRFPSHASSNNSPTSKLLSGKASIANPVWLIGIFTEAPLAVFFVL